MAGYLNLPTLALDFLRVTQFSADVLGSEIDGGNNGLGEGLTIERSGGGMTKVDYRFAVADDVPEQFEYINWLGARLNGGFRFINVPLWTDLAGPFPTISGVKTPIVTGIPHADGSYFSDGAGYSQATVWGEVTENAALNAGIIKLRMFGLDRPLRWSDWFSIYHADGKGWRCYRYWEVVNRTSEANPVYTLALQPPLRGAVSAGTRVEFARPLCAMKFPLGFSLPDAMDLGFFVSPAVSFVEAF